MTTRVRYLPALDGLRALAVAGVICYHGGLTWAPGGFLGVDLFFVLSGFLITTLLVGEWGHAGHIDLRAFWGRRAKRLLPALALVLTAVALYAALVAAPDELRTIRGDALSTMAYVTNWHFIVGGQSYFAQFSAPSPLRHMWSLAIEEQFYLFWPIIVFACLRGWRRGNRATNGGHGPSTRPLATVSIALLVASAVSMAVRYQPGHDPSRVYYGTDTRAQSLLVGALLAMLLIRSPGPSKRSSRVALQVAGVGAALGLAYLWTNVSDHSDSLYRGGLFGQAVLAAIVIAAVVQPQPGPLGAALSFAPLRWVGRISYGLYLWHWPIFVLLGPARVDLSGNSLFALRIAVTVVVATLSYYLVEMPIRRGRLTRPTLRFTAPATALAVLAALLLATAGAPPARVEISAGQLHPPEVATTQPGQERPRSMMLVGDSVADSLAPGLERVATAQGFVLWNASLPGCGTLVDTGQRWVGVWQDIDARCVPTWRERLPGQVKQFDPDVVIIMLSAHDTVDRRIRGREVRFDTAAGAARYRNELQDAIAVLSSGGAHVVVLTEPYFRQGWPQLVDPPRSSYNDSWVDLQNGYARKVVGATQRDDARTIDLNQFLDPGGSFTTDLNGVTVRLPDLIHLNKVGADLVAQWLAPKLLALGPRGIPAPDQPGGTTPSSTSTPTTRAAASAAGS